jgi:hypothetical protein
MCCVPACDVDALISSAWVAYAAGDGEGGWTFVGPSLLVEAGWGKSLNMVFLLCCCRRRHKSAVTRANMTNPLIVPPIMAPTHVDGRDPLTLEAEGDGIVDVGDPFVLGADGDGVADG